MFQKNSQTQFDSELRRQQNDDARQMSHSGETEDDAGRPTLTARKDFVRSPSRASTGRQVGAARPAPLKGHEAFLKALEFAGAILVVEKVSSGDKVSGILRHSDKFSVTIRVVTPGGSIDRVIFKHDISEFYSPTPRKLTPAEGQAA